MADPASSSEGDPSSLVLPTEIVTESLAPEPMIAAAEAVATEAHAAAPESVTNDLVNSKDVSLLHVDGSTQGHPSDATMSESDPPRDSIPMESKEASVVPDEFAAAAAAAASTNNNEAALNTDESASDESHSTSHDSHSSSTESSDDSSSGSSSSSSSEDPSEVGGLTMDEIDCLERELERQESHDRIHDRDDEINDDEEERIHDDYNGLQTPFTIDEDEEEDARESILLKEHLQSGHDSPLSYDDDAELGENGRTTPLHFNGSYRKQRIGQDRATVRRMVVQRIKGNKTWHTKRGRKHVQSAMTPRDIPLHWEDEAVPIPRGTRGWTQRNKRRRFCYAVMSVIIIVVGVALTIFGIDRQREYNRIQGAVADDDGYDDDNYYDDDDIFSTNDTGDAETLQSPPMNYYSPPSTAPSVVPDDALLLSLKMAYKNVLHSIPPTTETLHIIDSIETDLLNRSKQMMNSSEQSVQWRSYLSLLRRDDVIDKTTNTLVMNDELILQLYSLTCFFNNFNDVQEGENECQWTGIQCDDVFPETHTDVLFASPDDLRVVSLTLPGESLRGTLPMELIFLAHLETIELSNNFISGSLPKYFSTEQLESLKVLSFHDNRFEGTIPIEISKLKNLQKLTLQHNELVGELTNEICDLREHNLHFLWADCSTMPSTGVPKVPCPADCCTICFEGYDSDGGPSTGGTSPSSQVDTPHIVIGDWGADLKDKLSRLSTDGGMAFSDMNSPQFQAYGWLVEDSDGQGYDDKRLYQRYALATLYFSTGGVQWNNNKGWVTSLDECGWFGVSGCGDANSEAVVSIELVGNNLDGSIPSEFFVYFSDLMILNLADNHLRGSIPTSVGALTSLSTLELAENELTSHIPTELGKLTNLDHLFLQSNYLEGQMPHEVCALRSNHTLTMLWVDCNGFPPRVQCRTTCCTSCFTNPKNRTGSNEIEAPTTHADPERDVLATLKKMSPDSGVTLEDTSSPQFKAYSWIAGSDYTSLTDIKLLQRYALATLYFSTAGEGWTENDFWLSDNNECPNESAHWLGVDSCDGGGMVTRLNLSSNNLVGTLPMEISHLRMLQVMDVSDNKLYGSLPTQFGQFQELEVLQLSVNLLSGSIPDDLGFVFTLHELYFHKNSFTGSIPVSICDLKDPIGGLEVLWADCSGNPPPIICREFCCTECFSNSSEYVSYDDSDDGTYFPTLAPTSALQTQSPTVSENPELKAFLLKHMDGFQDSLSDVDLPAYKAYLWVANADNYSDLEPFNILQRFGLVSLYLSTTPDFDWKVSTRWQTKQHECTWFGIKCSDNNTVSEISLPNNRMSGTLPREIALAGVGGQMVYLDLSGNNIGGKIVSELGTLKKLAFLDLKANDFTGSIPSELGLLSKLKSLQLHANELTGEMPQEICSLRSGSLSMLRADCDPDNSSDEVTCPKDTCCTSCY
ncbi:hypothetical protein HJC23_011830 [Cyclotella cryptica]|uniref:Leucine-rich repeat-containing N-terminal plant-type domain-containing protein n=1 Tax=Cyclotella cryptica TaxID=29204 RepID=A0ABD3QFI8_9STRA|eukprot:CCRYP_006115-RB/>CCRYP_006115-RB protein AED:0.03 eAED:0.03 QI:94/1/1/1/1/1/5/38/1425